MPVLNVYNTREAADILKVHPETVRLWVREGKIKKVESIRKIRITENELNKFIGE